MERIQRQQEQQKKLDEQMEQWQNQLQAVRHEVRRQYSGKIL